MEQINYLMVFWDGYFSNRVKNTLAETNSYSVRVLQTGCIQHSCMQLGCIMWTSYLENISGLRD